MPEEQPNHTLGTRLARPGPRSGFLRRFDPLSRAACTPPTEGSLALAIEFRYFGRSRETITLLSELSIVAFLVLGGTSRSGSSPQGNRHGPLAASSS